MIIYNQIELSPVINECDQAQGSCLLALNQVSHEVDQAECMVRFDAFWIDMEVLR